MGTLYSLKGVQLLHQRRSSNPILVRILSATKAYTIMMMNLSRGALFTNLLHNGATLGLAQLNLSHFIDTLLSAKIPSF